MDDNTSYVFLTARLLFCAKQKGCVLLIELDCPFRILSKSTKGCLFGKERHNVHGNAAKVSKLYAISFMKIIYELIFCALRACT